MRSACRRPGWWNGDTPDTIKDGYEYCMAADIAYRAGLSKVAVVNVAWPQLIGGNTKNYDIALSEASITEPRKKVVDFSVPYFNSDISLLVKKDVKVDGGTAKDLRIGVHQGTTGADFIMNVLKPTEEVKVYANVPAMTAALTAGQIDAIANDTAYNLAYAKKSNGALVVIGQYKTGETYGAVYPKGSPNEAAFDKVIQAMKDDGTLDKLSQKYLAEAFGGDPSQGSVPQRPDGVADRPQRQPEGTSVHSGADDGRRAVGAAGPRRFRAAAPPKDATSAATSL